MISSPRPSSSHPSDGTASSLEVESGGSKNVCAGGGGRGGAGGPGDDNVNVDVSINCEVKSKSSSQPDVTKGSCVSSESSSSSP